MGSFLVLLLLMFHVLVSSLFLIGTTEGAIRYYDFVVKEANFTKLCSSKSILTVNGSFPGPKIHARRGDTVFVTIHNQGTYGITIHWHGVKQPRNPWSDGPENITQCPIPPGTNFTQEISFSSEEGTLWWHAHSDWSRATLHGPMIIRPPPHKSYPFPKPHKEKVLVLASWYKGDVMEVIHSALASGADPNVSDAYTINGRPGDTYPCSNEKMYRLKVKHGKSYLLRIINAVLNEEMFFGIAHHNLTIVGTDAAYVKPVTVSFLTIAPGQTMDVLVTAAHHQTLKNNSNNKYYYIVASPFADTTATFNNHSTTAIFEYCAANHTLINPPPPSNIPFPILPIYNDSAAAANFTAKLKSLATAEYPVNVPKNVTRRILMTIAVNALSCPNNSCSGPLGGRLSASLNNFSFVTPSVDILQSYYYNRVEMQRLQRGNKVSQFRFPNMVAYFYHLLIKMTGQKLLCRNSNSRVFATDFPDKPPSYFDFTGDVDNITMYTTEGTKVVMLDYGEAVEIVFQGTNISAAENHPMHLHGFNIYLVGTDTGNFDPAIDPQKYNLVDPPQVNTVGVPRNGWLAIRFFADNPGVWFVHCHLERHMSWGMSTVIIVKDGGTNETSIRPPPSYMPPCFPSS